MRSIFLISLITLSACEDSKSGTIEIKSSPHHHYALEAVKSALPPAAYFEVHQWHGPDTLTSWPETSIQTPIRYQLDFDYREKHKVLLRKRAINVFNGATDSILATDMMDRP